MTYRRKYNSEFKRQSVDLYTSGKDSMDSVADELGIPHSTFSRWCIQMHRNPESAFPGQGNIPKDQVFIKQLERELERTRRERDILKKALAIFSREPKIDSGL